jgi:hypothetical protein
MGIDGSITPATSGKVLLIISGEINNFGGNGAATTQISYGTGTPPANGDPATGIATGNSIQVISENADVPFTTNVVLTGLTIGTTYWIDLQLEANNGEQAVVAAISISAMEMP